MDIVGPAWMHSIGENWYVLVVVDDFSCYTGVFKESKDEAFLHARDLILMLKNEFPKHAVRAIHSDNGT